MENAKESSLSSFAASFFTRYPPNPDPLSIAPEIWLMAEQRTQEILHTVQPNVMSDRRRKGVIAYVRELINRYFGYEVYAFGSVPLKTYLPDGDVDLIAFCNPNMVENFAREVCSLLQRDRNPEFQVTYVEYIDAQVKVVKCTVENIAIDISFNQICGLCTLCFLEQVDQLIGKGHIFKRSVLLIKSWFYYESRLLSAHHGLISTYGLEIMVLYVISLYHESVRGPLEVLYRFMEYYSKFDWENDCITIHGPVKLSAFSGQTSVDSAEMQGDHDGIFLRKDFLRNCRDVFAVRVKSYEGEMCQFLVKNLNILDPLKPKNNLGRSVSIGSFHRITAAFSYGLGMLQDILVQPGEIMGERLEKLFQSTLERNGQGLRPDLLVPVAAFGTGKCELSDLNADRESYYSSLQFTQLYGNHTYVWDENMLSWTLQSNPGLPTSSNGFIPGARFVLHNPAFIPGSTFNPHRARRSRGTGTYIPQVRYNFNKDRYGRVRKRNHEPPQQGEKDDQVDAVVNTGKNDEEEEDGNDNHFDLSLEAFPSLQITTVAGPSEISAQVEASQGSPSLPRSPTPVATELTNIAADVSPALSEPDTAETGAAKQQELPESDELTLRDQPYELEDAMDFPPLAF